MLLAYWLLQGSYFLFPVGVYIPAAWLFIPSHFLQKLKSLQVNEKQKNKTNQNKTKKNKKWATLPRKEFSITSNSAIRFRLNTFAMFGKLLPLAKLLIKSKAYVHAALNTSQVGENSRTAL